MEVICENILHFIFPLGTTIKIADQLIYGLSWLESTFEMIYKAFKCLLVLSNHSHIKFDFVMGTCGGSI